MFVAVGAAVAVDVPVAVGRGVDVAVTVAVRVAVGCGVDVSVALWVDVGLGPAGAVAVSTRNGTTALAGVAANVADASVVKMALCAADGDADGREVAVDTGVDVGMLVALDVGTGVSAGVAVCVGVDVDVAVGVSNTVAVGAAARVGTAAGLVTSALIPAAAPLSVVDTLTAATTAGINSGVSPVSPLSFAAVSVGCCVGELALAVGRAGNASGSDCEASDTRDASGVAVLRPKGPSHKTPRMPAKPANRMSMRRAMPSVRFLL